jgi:hypothetical protein
MSFPPATEMFQFAGFAEFTSVITFPFNPNTDHSILRLNGEAGFPHSEIVGSKIAHISPTLIAACHVLHRLYMPRHPPNALTSRLRVHTTNDRAECARSKPRTITRQNPIAVNADNSTQHKIVYCERHHYIREECNHAATASISKPIHNVKDGAKCPSSRAETRKPVIFISGVI